MSVGVRFSSDQFYVHVEASFIGKLVEANLFELYQGKFCAKIRTTSMGSLNSHHLPDVVREKYHLPCLWGYFLALNVRHMFK
jgi:hypothetical protein